MEDTFITRFSYQTKENLIFYRKKYESPSYELTRKLCENDIEKPPIVKKKASTCLLGLCEDFPFFDENFCDLDTDYLSDGESMLFIRCNESSMNHIDRISNISWEIDCHLNSRIKLDKICKFRHTRDSPRKDLSDMSSHIATEKEIGHRAFDILCSFFILTADACNFWEETCIHLAE